MIESLDNLMRKASEDVRLNKDGEVEGELSEELQELLAGRQLVECLPAVGETLLNLLVQMPTCKWKSEFVHAFENNMNILKQEIKQKTKGDDMNEQQI